MSIAERLTYEILEDILAATSAGLIRQVGVQGNAWDGATTTGVNGFSHIVDTQNLPHISIMGEIDADSEISFFASHDGINFYFCDRITQTIGPVPPGPVENLATTGASFGSDPATSLGDTANLVEGATGFAQWPRGGIINDLFIWYDFGVLTRVNALEMFCQMSARAPQQFVFEGSANSTNGLDGDWTALFTQATSLNWISQSRRDFEVAAPGNYRFYRVRPTQVADANATRINEILLLGTEADAPVFPKQFHIYPTVGARFIRLRSSDDVTATITIVAKP